MASQKVEKFDFDGFKKSLICHQCKKPPRPGQQIYSCCYEKDDRCAYVECDDCGYGTCEHDFKPNHDLILTRFVEFMKVFHCIYFRNGCQEELEAKDLKAHEEICLFRNVDCPKLGCNAEIAFNGVMDHYQKIHTDLKMKDDVLEFKGSIEDLKKSIFVLVCYGKPFYPQFYMKEDMFHFWVIGQGDQDEINSFEVTVKFWINERTTVAHDFVKSIDDIYDNMLFSGKDGVMIPVKKLTQYYDVQSKKFKNQDFIEFEMKVTCPKLDEVAMEKNENVESGVEDSETEEK